MQMTFRWYGAHDRVPLAHIRQIPGVRGIVSAVYDVPVGDAWPEANIAALLDTVSNAGLAVAVIESIPMHEAIKLGTAERDRYVDAYCDSVARVGAAGVPVVCPWCARGVPVVCYNFMPIFDWTRTDLAFELPDGSTTLTDDQDALSRIDLSNGTGELPGWSTAYDAEALSRLLHQWKAVDAEQLWENLGYFLERVVPVAASSGVRMAIYPDDPPWSIFGLPRIITDDNALRRVLSLVDHPSNGLTFCTGSLGSSANNDVPGMVREFAELQRSHFMHCRNVKRVGTQSFREVAHPSEFGDVDMRAVLQALHDNTPLQIRTRWSSPSPGAPKTVCGACGTVCRTWHDRRRRQVRDLPCGALQVLLEFELRT